MAEPLRILRTVVACPGDVHVERASVRTVVDELNRGMASVCGFRLEVIGWDIDAHPGFHPDGPQGLIDPILDVDNADLVIGIFWKRFGTPGRDGLTGTEHEIGRARDAFTRMGRAQVLLYFNDAPYSPRSRDEAEEWGKVLSFKDSLAATGLTWAYCGAPHFESLLRNHLTNYLRSRPEARTRDAVDPATASPLRGHIPPAPALVIGRENAIGDLKRRLGVEPRAAAQPVTVVRGWPGVGKSTVAAVLAHDPEVAKAFPDGVLWMSVGKTPALASALAQWGRAFGNDALLQSATLKQAVHQLGTLLGQKRVLMIVDDVWEMEHAAPFLHARGPRCAALFTTRETAVASDIASPHQDAVYHLTELSQPDAVQLLRVFAPRVVAEYPNESHDLVGDLERLPLAIHVAGRLLRVESNLGWRVSDLLQDLRTGTRILGEKAPADRTDFEKETTPTIAALLRESTDRLSDVVRDCFASLGAFAPKPATFDLRALRGVWDIDDPAPVVRELVNRGLLEPIGERFQMHALLVSYARAMLSE